MNFLFIVSALLPFASADFNGDLAVASSNAVQLDNRVQQWNEGQGLFGALNIQNYYPTLSSAISVLSRDAGSLTDSDVDTSNIHSFAAAIIKLLDDLTAKSNELKQVQAGGIVASDLQGLGGPAAAIVSDIIRAVTSDCGKVKLLTPDLDGISKGFSSANAAYGAAQINFATAPSC